MLTESKSKIKSININEVLPAIPWQDRPAGSHDLVWRYAANPIIPRDLIPCSNSIFNSAVVPFKTAYAGVFRCDDKRRNMRLHAGFSTDGIKWNMNNDPIRFISEDSEIGNFEYGYDPRVCWIDDRYYVTWPDNRHSLHF